MQVALLSIFRGTQAECSARPVSDGTLLFATDTKKIYLDKDSSRIEMSSVDDLGNYVTKEQLTTALNGKANTTHTHTQDQITGFKDALAGKASTSHSHSVASGSASGFMSAADKQKLDGIAAGANKYTLPIASSTALGGVKIGYKESGKNYSVKLDDNNQAYVTVPWTDTTSKDTNTTYTLTKNGSTITLEGSDGSSTAVNDDNTTYSLGSFGITATAAELNYVDGVTSNIQTQLNSKAASSHNHSAANITSGTLSADRIPTITDGKIQSVSASKITGTIPQSILPSYVDDVLEYENLAAFPKTGESGKIYVADDTNKTYRWSGTAYVEISASLALGTTSSTAFRGDYGNAAYAHAQAKGSAFSSGLYKITTNSQGHVTAATAVTKSDITALGIPGSDTNTNTTYSLSKSGSTITLKGSDGSTTSVTDADTNTTYSTFKGATTSAAGGTGLVPAPATGAANRYLRSDGTWQVPPDNNTTYSNMGGASSSAAGHAGLVPAPAAGASNRYLRSDGTWSVPPDNNTNTTYSLSKNGSTITLTGSDGSKTSVTDSNTTYSLSSFGVNASAAELNYVKGVTSSIQTQLNGKAASNHTHNYAGADSAGGAAKEVKNWGNATDNVARHVWFSNNGADNQRVYNDNFKYNPVGNTVSCNISGTANVANSLNGTVRYVTQNSVDKPYWRCLKLESAQRWLDSSIILCVDAGYETGGFGILAVRFRNDDVPQSDVATHGTVQWLCRYGYEPDQFILKIHSAKATTGYADLYFHATGTYNSCNIRILANSIRGGNGSFWQLMNEEPRAAMDTRAYTAQATGYDVGKVAYASSAGSANSVPWGGVSGKPSTYPPSSHTHTKSQITDFPSSLKNPNSLTVSLNGTSQGAYDGSAAKSINVTPASIGAAASSHNHDASNIISGTLSADRIPTITGAKIAADSVTLTKLGSDVGTVAVQSAQPSDTNVKLWIQI